jgi:hypothetical protein
MSTARKYRAKAAECTELLKTASSPSEAREFRDLEQSFITLAENDEWLLDNLEKTNSSSAEDNSYGDILSARQKKTPLGCLETVDPKQSTEIATKIQQLFDDAGSKGGLSQTATLRGQVSRFLQKHKGDSFS